MDLPRYVAASSPNRLRFSLLAVAIAFVIGIGVTTGRRPTISTAPPEASSASVWRPPIQVAMGKVRPPLKYRIVSFHRGRADKGLVRLAAELGFNGVQIQLEGSTVEGIRQFAQYDAREHLVDFCHKLGMSVTIWVHELSDVPPPWMPDFLGPPTAENEALWSLLDARYEWALHEAIPNIDGLALTVVETQVRATDPDVLLRLTAVLRAKCDKYGKSLMVRTFVWYPEEFENVMSAVGRLPRDTVVMSKCVPQDWNLRGTDASEIGRVGGRTQIEEYDVGGEYFLRDHVANCMVDLLKRQFDYGLKHGVQGICVRVDREDTNILQEPTEVNLWALAMLADGATDDMDQVWRAWATNRFGKDAADGAAQALKPAGEVVAEMLSIGPFSFGDTRKFPPLGDGDVYSQLHQNYWWDAKYVPIHEQAESGDPAFVAEARAAKDHAKLQAELCLQDLELARDKLAPEDYAILKTKLLTNKEQLSFRAPMAMAVLHYRGLIDAGSEQERAALDQALQADLAQVREAAATMQSSGLPQQIMWLGKTWLVGRPEEIYGREAVYAWAYQMDRLRLGEEPGPPSRRRANWWSRFTSALMG